MGGGGGYDGDVDERSSVSRSDFNFERESRAKEAKVVKELKVRDEMNILLSPTGIRECCYVLAQDVHDDPGAEGLEPEQVMPTTPIIVAFDTTASRGEDAIIMLKKMPLLIGQIYLHKYASYPSVAIWGFGDAVYDKIPIQLGQFEGSNLIDDNLKWLQIEENGGGNGDESPELIVYAAARHTRHDAFDHGRKGFLFIISDEGFYPEVDADQVKKLFGKDIGDDIPAEQIFKEAQEMYHIFLIYPRANWDERVAQISKEMQKRVEGAGGTWEENDIQVGADWKGFNDLDLHCEDPDGHHIYFQNMKPRGSVGHLDVDANGSGPETKTPVEHIRFPLGKAKNGKYKFWLRTYAYHVDRREPIPYRVLVYVDGKEQVVEGIMSPKLETGEKSDQLIIEFDYQRGARATDDDRYANYHDDVVLGKWSKVLPEAHIVRLQKSKAIVDAQLGIIGIVEGTTTLDEYDSHMEDREQTPERREDVCEALRPVAQMYTRAKNTASGSIPGSKKSKKKKAKLI